MLNELGDIVVQFDSHGRSLAAMVELVEGTNRRTEEAVTARRQEIDDVITALDSRTEDLDLRLKRFSGLLDESLVAAEGRARDIARLVAEASSQGARAIAEHHERVRMASEEERQRTTESLHGVYEQASNEAHALFRQTASEAEAMLHGATDALLRRAADHAADGRRNAARTRRHARGAAARHPANCRRRPPRARRSCAG